MRIALVLVGLLILSGGAFANEASIKAAVEARFPKAKVESVQKVPFANLYEVFVDRQIVYTDEGVTHFFAGKIMEAGTNRNLTDERLRKLSEVSFGSLPLDLAIKSVKGTGERKLVVFSDPHCPYCQQLEKDLALVTDVTIYTFLYPLENLHPGATALARAIWCSGDRAKAWDEWMLRGKEPVMSATCETPLAALRELGRKYRFGGTPTLIFSDGSVVPGALELRQIEATLRKAGQS